MDRYIISDVPDLASFFEEQFGSKNYFGGNGTTTFAVPDMRNLFLRGFHGDAEEQLSDEIGARQEGTEIPNVYAGPSAFSIIGEREIRRPENVDSGISYTKNYQYQRINAEHGWDESVSSSNNSTWYTVRPVNIAVLYCIKAVESLPAENIYSIEETRIGTWIDGKPLYRRVLQGTTSEVADGTDIAFLELPNVSIDVIITLKGTSTPYNGAVSIPLPQIHQYHTSGSNPYGITAGISIWYNYSKKALCERHINSVYSNLAIIITFEYTKTTDKANASIAQTISPVGNILSDKTFETVVSDTSFLNSVMEPQTYPVTASVMEPQTYPVTASVTAANVDLG